MKTLFSRSRAWAMGLALAFTMGSNFISLTLSAAGSDEISGPVSANLFRDPQYQADLAKVGLAIKTLNDLDVRFLENEAKDEKGEVVGTEIRLANKEGKKLNIGPGDAAAYKPAFEKFVKVAIQFLQKYPLGDKPPAEELLPLPAGADPESYNFKDVSLVMQRSDELAAIQTKLALVSGLLSTQAFVKSANQGNSIGSLPPSGGIQPQEPDLNPTITGPPSTTTFTDPSFDTDYAFVLAAEKIVNDKDFYFDVRPGDLEKGTSPKLTFLDGAGKVIGPNSKSDEQKAALVAPLKKLEAVAILFLTKYPTVNPPDDQIMKDAAGNGIKFGKDKSDCCLLIPGTLAAKRLSVLRRVSGIVYLINKIFNPTKK